MIQKIQNFFQTDKWWGKFLFTTFLYFMYFFIFYLVIPFLIFWLQGSNFGGVFFLILIFFIAPVLSYKIPKSLKNIYPNKNLYIYHYIFVIILPFVYSFLLYRYILSQLYFGGF